MDQDDDANFSFPRRATPKAYDEEQRDEAYELFERDNLKPPQSSDIDLNNFDRIYWEQRVSREKALKKEIAVLLRSSSSGPFLRSKLMVVGEGRAGKTTTI